MMHTYLDDTGKYLNWSRAVQVHEPRDPGNRQRVVDPLVLLGIGGAIATTDEWERIGGTWQDILDSFGLPMFHAAAFDAGIEPYRALPDAARDNLVRKLVASIQRVIPVVALLRPDVYAYNHDDPGHLGRPDEEREHDPCFWFCLARAARHAGDGKARVTFARTPKYVGRPQFLHRCFAKYHTSGSRLDGELVVAETKDVMQLQVADLIVWGFNCLSGRNPDPREEAEGLRRYLWWVERIGGLVVREDCRLIPPKEAEQIYAEIAELCA